MASPNRKKILTLMLSVIVMLTYSVFTYCCIMATAKAKVYPSREVNGTIESI